MRVILDCDEDLLHEALNLAIKYYCVDSEPLDKGEKSMIAYATRRAKYAIRYGENFTVIVRQCG